MSASRDLADATFSHAAEKARLARSLPASSASAGTRCSRRRRRSGRSAGAPGGVEGQTTAWKWNDWSGVDVGVENPGLDRRAPVTTALAHLAH